MNADHVLTLFAEANPVPDVDVVRRELRPSTVDLATLESRSRIMQTEELEHVETTATLQRRPNPAWVFAIALVATLVAVGGGVLLMRGGEEPTVVDQPTTTLVPTHRQRRPQPFRFLAKDGSWLRAATTYRPVPSAM